MSSSSFFSSRPTRSSSCHRVITTTMRPSGVKRVYNVDAYQSHTFCRMTWLFASSAFLIGSSMIAMRAPLPVIGPPTPAALSPPRCPLTPHDSAPLLSGSISVSNTPAFAASVSRAMREKPLLRSMQQALIIISSSGLRPICHAGNFFDTTSLLPCRGGIVTMTRRSSPDETRSSVSVSTSRCILDFQRPFDS
ncbi:hypothetical protein D3C84_880130 [compost metagenome]